MCRIRALLYLTHYDIRHLRRNCRDWIDRDAVFVTKSNAETYALNGTPQSVNSNGTHSRALSLHGRSLTQVEIGPKVSKVEPVAEKKDAVEATSLAAKPNGEPSTR